METYTILHWARTTYAGFNDLHLCEKLGELEGFSFGRETLRRISPWIHRHLLRGNQTPPLRWKSSVQGVTFLRCYNT